MFTRIEAVAPAGAAGLFGTMSYGSSPQVSNNDMQARPHRYSHGYGHHSLSASRYPQSRYLAITRRSEITCAALT